MPDEAVVRIVLEDAGHGAGDAARTDTSTGGESQEAGGGFIKTSVEAMIMEGAMRRAIDPLLKEISKLTNTQVDNTKETRGLIQEIKMFGGGLAKIAPGIKRGLDEFVTGSLTGGIKEGFKDIDYSLKDVLKGIQGGLFGTERGRFGEIEAPEGQKPYDPKQVAMMEFERPDDAMDKASFAFLQAKTLEEKEAQAKAAPLIDLVPPVGKVASQAPFYKPLPGEVDQLRAVEPAYKPTLMGMPAYHDLQGKAAYEERLMPEQPLTTQDEMDERKRREDARAATAETSARVRKMVEETEARIKREEDKKYRIAHQHSHPKPYSSTVADLLASSYETDTEGPLPPEAIPVQPPELPPKPTTQVGETRKTKKWKGWTGGHGKEYNREHDYSEDASTVASPEEAAAELVPVAEVPVASVASPGASLEGFEPESGFGLELDPEDFGEKLAESMGMAAEAPAEPSFVDMLESLRDPEDNPLNKVVPQSAEDMFSEAIEKFQGDEPPPAPELPPDKWEGWEPHKGAKGKWNLRGNIPEDEWIQMMGAGILPPNPGNAITARQYDAFVEWRRSTNQGPPSFSQGGTVPGQAQGTDTIPAWLTPGEVVVNKDAASANKGLLEDMNRGVKHLAEGGETSSPNAINVIGSAVRGTISTDTDPGSKINQFGEAIGGLNPIVGATVQAFGALIQEIDKTVEKYGEYSPQIAQAQAIAEVRQTLGDMRRAQEAGDVLAKYVITKSDMQQKIEEIKMKALMQIVPVVTKILEVIEAIMPSGEGINTSISGLRDPLDMIAQSIESILGIERDKKLPDVVDPTDILLNIVGPTGRYRNPTGQETPRSGGLD
jgi:hypothetical protein